VGFELIEIHFIALLPHPQCCSGEKLKEEQLEKIQSFY